MTEITGGELLLRSLHAEQVRHIHAITDGTYMIFLEALERLGDELDMQLIVPRHEAAGAHFADACTRITGKPSVVMACAGPGAANLLSGIICAQAEGSPVVAITTKRRSDVSDDYRHMGGTQSPDHLALFRPAVKWNGRIDHWQHIPDMVRHAFRVATSGSPGPVHLLIPENILSQKGDPAKAPIWPLERTRITERVTANPAQVQRAAEMIVAAGMLNIHAGNGANRSGAGPEILALAEYLSSPVTNNATARGIIPEDHDLLFPPLCMAAYMTHVQSDLILAVGTRLGELAMWARPPLWGDPAEQPLIQIESDPANIGLNRPVDVALIGDAKAVMQQLLEAVQALTSPQEPDPRLAELQEVPRPMVERTARRHCRYGACTHAHRPDIQSLQRLLPRRRHCRPRRWQHQYVVDALHRAPHAGIRALDGQHGPPGHRPALCHRRQDRRSRPHRLLRLRRQCLWL